MRRLIHGGSGTTRREGSYQGIAIPFDFDLDQWLVLNNEELGIDYAATILRPIYRAALEAGGACPLPSQAWGSHQIDYDYWALLGIPWETVSHEDGTIISAKTVTLILEPADSPAGPSEKDEFRFYAKLVGDSADAIRSVEGMSGGPIFGLRAIEGVWHYSAIGVQSGWFPGSRVLIACPFVVFVAALIEVLSSIDDGDG